MLSDLARALAGQLRERNAALLHVARDGRRSAALEAALAFFAPDLDVLSFPAWDCQPYDRVSPNAAVVARRMTTLSRLARREGRVILTRDRRLLRDPNLPAHVFIEADGFRDQLRQVAAALGLRAGRPFSRCVACNRVVAPVARDVVGGRVPPYVLATQSDFRECHGCGRVYWPATHRAHIVAELVALGLDEARA